MQKKVIDRICLVCGQAYGELCDAEPDPTPQELYADNLRLRARVEELEVENTRLRQTLYEWWASAPQHYPAVNIMINRTREALK